MMTRFERITARQPDGKNVTHRCEIVAETDDIVIAHILDRNWDQGGQRDKETGMEIWQEWLLAKSLIVKRVPMRENRHTGSMEPIK